LLRKLAFSIGFLLNRNITPKKSAAMKNLALLFFLSTIPAFIYAQDKNEKIDRDDSGQNENLKEEKKEVGLNTSYTYRPVNTKFSPNSSIERPAKSLSSESSDGDGYNLGVGRIFYALNNYHFSGSGEVEGGLSRTTLYWAGSGIDEFSLELMLSSGYYSTSEIEYEDNLYGFSLSYPLGIDMDGIRVFIRGVAGAVYYKGETKIEIMDITERTNFSDWSLYYNLTLGADIFFNDGFGITGEVGISKIPLVSIGLIL